MSWCRICVRTVVGVSLLGHANDLTACFSTKSSRATTKNVVTLTRIRAVLSFWLLYTSQATINLGIGLCYFELGVFNCGNTFCGCNSFFGSSSSLIGVQYFFILDVMQASKLFILLLLLLLLAVTKGVWAGVACMPSSSILFFLLLLNSQSRGTKFS